MTRRVVKKIAQLEAFSWAALIVTMMLKYGLNMPGPNKVVGMIHGVLFILFIICAFLFASQRRMAGSHYLIIVVAGFLPFATLWYESKFLKE